MSYRFIIADWFTFHLYLSEILSQAIGLHAVVNIRSTNNIVDLLQKLQGAVIIGTIALLKIYDVSYTVNVK